MKINRNIIRPDLIFDTHLGEKTTQDFYNRINDFKAFILNRKLENKQVCISHEVHFDFLALIFALLEYGIDFRSCLINSSNIKTLLKESSLIFWRNTDYENVSEYVEHLVDPTDVPIGYGCLNHDVVEYKKDSNTIWYSTGTTGEPAKVLHNHESMLRPALIAKDRFYKEDDIYYATATIAHAGVFPIGFLAPLMKVKRFILHPLEDGINTDLIDKSTICLLFYYQHKNSNLKFNNIRIITGGEPLRNFWAEELFKNGVHCIHNVYGTTQTLPPIFVKDYYVNDIITNELGELLEPYSAEIVNKNNSDILWIKSPWYELTSTGDSVFRINGKYYFNGRNSLCFRKNGVLVDPTTVKFIIEKEFSYMFESIQIITNLIRGNNELQMFYISNYKIDLDIINRKLVEDLGPEHTLHSASKLDYFEFNSIYKVGQIK